MQAFNKISECNQIIRNDSDIHNTEKNKKKKKKKKKSLITKSWNKCQTGACIVHMEFCFETMSVTVSKLLQP